jgi:hypothetical protein
MRVCVCVSVCASECVSDWEWDVTASFVRWFLGSRISRRTARDVSVLLRASVHERFSAVAVKKNAAADWLCARTLKETLTPYVLFIFESWILCRRCVRCAGYSVDFVESVAVCALLLRTAAKRREKFWVRPLVSQRVLEGQFYRLRVDLRVHPKKFFGYFRMSCSSFDAVLFINTPSTVMGVRVPGSRPVILSFVGAGR